MDNELNQYQIEIKECHPGKWRIPVSPLQLMAKRVDLLNNQILLEHPKGVRADVLVQRKMEFLVS